MPVCRPVVVALLALSVVACADEVEVFDENVCTREQTHSLRFWQKGALDVLVVLDRSPSMEATAPDVAAFAHTLHDVLATIEGGVPDLHLAVVTSELAARNLGCGAGDAGIFQGAARCGLDGEFLRARGLTAGGVGGNFAGTFEETLACLLDVPPSTCPVSQPLGAAVAALDGRQSSNAGFRREYAYLVVVVITATDDGTLGTLGRLADVDALVAQLRGFVSDRKMLAVSSIAAPWAPRLASVNLPERGSHTCVCQEEWSDALIWLAELIKYPLIGLCLEAKHDLDLATPGFQVNCANRIAGGDDQIVAPLPWCDEPGVDQSRPCIRLREADRNWCTDGAVPFEVSLGDERLPSEIYVELRCEVACE